MSLCPAAVIVWLRATGDAPILKQPKFKVIPCMPHHPACLLLFPKLKTIANAEEEAMPEPASADFRQREAVEDRGDPSPEGTY